MTITRGEPWGSVGPAPVGVVFVASNRELADVVNLHRAAGRPIPPLGLLGGDLCRAVGGTGDPGRFSHAEVALLPIDLLRVQVGVDEEARTFWAATHVVVRRGWWRGPVVVVMNAQFLGRWDVAPRAHPNDGRADVVELDASMPANERWKAWRRLPTGTHLPHPKLRVRQVQEVVLPEVPGGRLYVDGHRRGIGRLEPGTPVRVTVEPDAALVCV